MSFDKFESVWMLEKMSKRRKMASFELQSLRNVVKEFGLDGFMMGREAYQNPYILSDVDTKIFRSSQRMKISRRDVVFKIANYIDKFLYEDNEFAIIRHILGLYNNMPGARKWRSNLVKKESYFVKGDKLRFATDEIELLHQVISPVNRNRNHKTHYRNM